MNRTIHRITLMAGAAALALPAMAAAQQPAPRVMELPRADATRILDMRRVLDLTPRQVMQLDSLERVQVAARRAMAEQMRARRDSAGRGVRAGIVERRGAVRVMRDSARAMSPEQRQAMRDSVRRRMEARMTELRPQLEQARRRDSAGRAAAERVLNDAQRQRLREIQAEERGRQRGLREARTQRGGGAMAPRGRVMRPGTPSGMRSGMRPAMRAGTRAVIRQGVRPGTVERREVRRPPE